MSLRWRITVFAVVLAIARTSGNPAGTSCQISRDASLPAATTIVTPFALRFVIAADISESSLDATRPRLMFTTRMAGLTLKA